MRISDCSSDVCSSDLVFDIGVAGGLLLHLRLFDQVVELLLLGTRAVAAHRRPGEERLVLVELEAHRVLELGLCGKRSEERRVGKECVSTCVSRWSQYH